jgi:hypothetical protein
LSTLRNKQATTKSARFASRGRDLALAMSLAQFKRQQVRVFYWWPAPLAPLIKNKIMPMLDVGRAESGRTNVNSPVRLNKLLQIISDEEAKEEELRKAAGP